MSCTGFAMPSSVRNRAHACRPFSTGPPEGGSRVRPNRSSGTFAPCAPSVCAGPSAFPTGEAESMQRKAIEMHILLHPAGNGSSPERRRLSRRRLMGAVGAATLATAALAGAAAAPAQAEPRGAVVPSPSSAPTQEQIDAQSERSVVQLAIEYEAYVDSPDANGDWYRSSEPVQVAFSCTGWFVDTTGDIVTAGHCVDPKDPEVKTALVDEFLQEQDITDSDTAAWAEKTFTLENSSGDAQPEQTVLAYQSPDVDGAVLTNANGTVAHVQAFKPFDDEDLALLNVVTKKSTPALPVAASTPDVGAPVTSIGFPGAASGGAGAQQASFKTGTISSRQVLPSGVARLEVNADIGQGMSGGPTIDATGAVVGVNSALNGDGHGDFNWITDT